jgi:hypothetical protein
VSLVSPRTECEPAKTVNELSVSTCRCGCGWRHRRCSSAQARRMGWWAYPVKAHDGEKGAIGSHSPPNQRLDLVDKEGLVVYRRHVRERFDGERAGCCGRRWSGALGRAGWSRHVSRVVLHALVVRSLPWVLVVVAQLAGRVVVRAWKEEAATVGRGGGGALWGGHKLVVAKVEGVRHIEVRVDAEAAAWATPFVIYLPVSTLTVGAIGLGVAIGRPNPAVRQRAQMPCTTQSESKGKVTIGDTPWDGVSIVAGVLPPLSHCHD